MAEIYMLVIFSQKVVKKIKLFKVFDIIPEMSNPATAVQTISRRPTILVNYSM